LPLHSKGLTQTFLNEALPFPLINGEHHGGDVLQVVVDDVEAFRSKVNDAVAVTDNLDKHRQTWLERTSCLKAQTARFEAVVSS